MDKDISRRAAEGAAAILMHVKRSVRETIPYGPSKVRLTPSELREKLRRSSPDSLQRLMQYLGPEQALQMLLGAWTQRTPPSLEQFMEEQDGVPN